MRAVLGGNDGSRSSGDEEISSHAAHHPDRRGLSGLTDRVENWWSTLTLKELCLRRCSRRAHFSWRRRQSFLARPPALFRQDGVREVRGHGARVAVAPPRLPRRPWRVRKRGRPLAPLVGFDPSPLVSKWPALPCDFPLSKASVSDHHHAHPDTSPPRATRGAQRVCEQSARSLMAWACEKGVIKLWSHTPPSTAGRYGFA